jgi:hypothetical protein
MTWPTTPINTTNLDNGADEPRLARADLKNMADAVNDMIAQGGAATPAFIKYGITITTTNGTTFAPVLETPNTLTAGGTGVTVSTNNIVVPAGTWLFETSPSSVESRSSGGLYINEIRLRNTTNNTTVDGEIPTTYETNAGANTVTEGFLGMNGVATFATSVNLQFQAKSIGGDVSKSWGTQTGVGLYIKITKIA